MREKRITDLKELRRILLSINVSKQNVKECQKVKVLTRKRFGKDYKVS